MIEIVYQDQDIIVINKPPGISVHGGDSVSGRTVVDFLLEQFPELRGVGEDPARPGIVHRLDKNTSGIMVVARTQKSFETLKNIFKTRQVEKIYHAIVCGLPQSERGIIDFSIGRLVKNPTKRGVAKGRSRIRGERTALTEYRVLKSGTKYSLIELHPKTGRMHQLRVHMKAIGHPIACDVVYGGKNVCCPTGCNRQLLHARSISFSFPEGRKLFFEADEPEDMIVAEKEVF